MKPHLTEKSYQLANSKKPVFTFLLNRRQDKLLIKRSIKKKYQVDPVKIRLINENAKPVQFKGVKGSRKARRKVLVTLKAGQKIKAFEVNTKNKKDEEK